MSNPEPTPQTDRVFEEEEQFVRAMNGEMDEESNQHEQRLARERHEDQIRGPSGDQWGPPGQNHVGGP